MKPLGVIINPAANRGSAAAIGPKVFSKFAELGIDVIDFSADSAASAKAGLLARSQELSGVVVAGGDGTSQLGVNIAMETGLPLGLIPAGSGNDQVRQLGISLDDPHAAVENIAGALAKPRQVDVMLVEKSDRRLWSLGSVSAGFDAICAQRANGLKWPKGPNSYVAAMLLELPRFKPIDYRIVADGAERTIRAMLCGVANVKNFGGGMKISPDSEITDGEVEVFILHEVSRPRLLQIFPKVYEGRHVEFPEVEIFKAKEIRVENSGFPTSCDGELIGPAPFSVSVHPAALSLLSK